MVYPEGPSTPSPPGPTRHSPPGPTGHRPGSPARIVVLVSGSGTNLQALIDAVAADPDYGAEIVAVGADRTICQGLERAEKAGIPTFALRVRDFASGEREQSAARGDWDRALRDAVSKHQPDLVVLAGFMKLVGPDFLAEFGGRVINTHPALSPSFPGMHGPQDALDYGVKVTGCTVFFVTAGVDDGPVVAQAAVPVEDDDDVESLHERIKTAERALLVDVVGRLARSGWTITERKVTIPADGRAATVPGLRKATNPVSATVPIKRALVSVYDKTGLEDLVRGLHAAGVALVSTGGSAALIRSLDIPVTEVQDLTGFPECLDGRVKTLHPKIHAGILADRRLDDHVKQLADLGVEPFDLVVSNLYPFTATVASGASPDECIELIDIGGPSMVRGAAKNHPSVAIVVNPDRYADVLTAVTAGGFTLEQRKRLAAEAFAHTAAYDAAVASWFASAYAPDSEAPFPDFVASTYQRKAVLRYGENPHQGAALYLNNGTAHLDSLATAEQLHGKEMSYNNYVDTDAAVRSAYDFAEACVAIIKHANPCGIAVSAGGDIAEAHRLANECDPVSAFGGIIAANRPVTAAMAAQVNEVFTEVIIAPDYEPAALELLTAKKNIRILRSATTNRRKTEYRQICGGLLLQDGDLYQSPGDDPATWTLATGAAADAATLADLVFAWRAIRSVKSNAILLASGLASVGVGMGQVNRVDSAHLAVKRAGDKARGSVAASDAYFPFPDGFQVLADAGVKAVVQPGGSVRDELVIAAARESGVTMYLTGTRHFTH